MVNDKPSIPAYVDTLQKLTEYVQYNAPTESAELEEFWKSVDNRVSQFLAFYTDRAELEELKDGPEDRGYN